MESLKIRRLASNFTLLSGGEVVSKICTFAAFAYLARVLGPTHFGYLEFTLAIMVFFNLFVDFGSSPYGAREVAKDNEQAAFLGANIIVLRILFAVTAYLLLAALVFFLPDENTQLRRLILIYGLTLFGIPAFLQWVFQGFDKMKWVALGSMIRQLIFALGVFLLIRRSDQLWVVAWIEFVAVCGFVAYNLYIYRSKIGRFEPRITFGTLKNSLVMAMPIGLSELTWASTWYVATVFLGLFIESNAVGWFSAAHRPVMTLHTFIWLYFFNLLPSMSRCANLPKANIQQLISGSVRITMWFGVFLGAAGMILAGPMITLVYGEHYAPAAGVLMILIWVLPIALLSGHYRYVLIAFNHQKAEFFSSVIGAVTSIVLGFVLISRYSTYGAAIALLAAAVVNLILAYGFVQRRIGRITFWPHLSKPMLAGCAMVAGFLILLPLHRWLASVGGVMLFGLVLILSQPEAKRLLF
jgi:O-antigen/teichoic acid export membrane protein